ncbi:MAG TPA: peptidyl-prolyl cis-trans isomerase [Dissulfurispiraceae bacterium]|nr:peptidyl-prolyl cis-trans isomerase [Dissulfurispiraceae bacterium]
MKKIVMTIAACALLVGCANKPADQGGSSPVVATVDNVVITAKDVQEEMKGLPDVAKQFFQGPEGTTRFVDELAKKEMLYLEAKKRGIDKEKDVEKRIEDFKKIVMINKMLEKEIEAKAKPTDQEIKEFYDKNKEEFIESGQVRLSQIVVKNEEDAKKAMERLQKGDDFKAVAADLSKDKSAKAGGDIGFFKRGELDPQLENVAFRLKKNQPSPPIPLKDGIHIIKVTEIKGTPVEFEKAKPIIVQRLTMDRQKTTFDKFIEDVKKTYKVDINKDEIAKMSGGAPAPAPAPATPEAAKKPAEAPAQKPAEAPAQQKPAEAPKK